MLDPRAGTRLPARKGKHGGRRGVPRFGAVHSLRQRLCMTELRCQICGVAADRASEGVLWLVDADPWDLAPGGETTAHPPVCRPCAHLSVRACPHLRTRQVALCVRTFRPAGVRGALYAPAPGGPRLHARRSRPTGRGW